MRLRVLETRQDTGNLSMSDIQAGHSAGPSSFPQLQDMSRTHHSMHRCQTYTWVHMPCRCVTDRLSRTPLWSNEPAVATPTATSSASATPLAPPDAPATPVAPALPAMVVAPAEPVAMVAPAATHPRRKQMHKQADKAADQATDSKAAAGDANFDLDLGVEECEQHEGQDKECQEEESPSLDDVLSVDTGRWHSLSKHPSYRPSSRLSDGNCQALAHGRFDITRASRGGRHNCRAFST